ncbi:MAG: alpha/beta fold hydrolase [Pseudomonadota bacterium]
MLPHNAADIMRARHAPQRAGDVAFAHFCRPTLSHHRPPDHARLIARARRQLTAARFITVPWPGGSLQAYAFEPDAAPTRSVLLVHGWTSEASVMTAFAEPLRRKGVRVIAFDMPAHGLTLRGAPAGVIDGADLTSAGERPTQAVTDPAAGGAAPVVPDAMVSEPTRAAALPPTRSAALFPTRAAALFPTRSATLLPSRSATLLPTRSAALLPTRSATMLDCARALHAVTNALGPFDGIIAHSMGALVALLVLEGGPPLPGPCAFQRMALIASPNRLSAITSAFAVRHSLSRPAQRAFERHLERVGHRPLERFSAAALLANAPSQPRVLITHSADDTDVPIAHAHELIAAHPSLTTQLVNHLGHARILYAPPTVRTVRDFMVDGSA